MRLLLDTHTLLWFLANGARLSRTAKTAIEDLANERWLSPISLLEIAIKMRLGKLPLPAPFAVMFPADLLAADIHLLPLEADHTLGAPVSPPASRTIGNPAKSAGSRIDAITVSHRSPAAAAIARITEVLPVPGAPQSSTGTFAATATPSASTTAD